MSTIVDFEIWPTKLKILLRNSMLYDIEKLIDKKFQYESKQSLLLTEMITEFAFSLLTINNIAVCPRNFVAYVILNKNISLFSSHVILPETLREI